MGAVAEFLLAEPPCEVDDDIGFARGVIEGDGAERIDSVRSAKQAA
jgi:hypothetical protein